MSEKVNIILNGNIVDGYRGETILELATRNGIEIPTLCNDPRLEPFTSCFVCVVEVEGLRGLQPSCSTKISEGMRIETDNEKIHRARKTALDLLVSNHYADCIGPCKQTCPAGVDVQGYISLIEKGKYHDAVGLIKETNPLPAICGRVCVRPCEVACRRNLLDEGAAVGIDYLKRFASDIDIDSPDKWKPVIKPATGKKVAVIGAGPAGLSAGFFLQKEGHQVDIYEAAPKAGGWLRYGIPEYRLPNDLLQKEVDNITEMGVNIQFNKKFGKDISYKDLRKQYDAMILTIGSQKGTLIGCEGEDAENVFSGIDFLKEMEITGERFNFKGKKVAVIGGGNTAMDCCRTSKRCGAEKVYVIYRRTENEMPANPIEIHESKLEGVEYMFLTNPTKVNKDDKGRVKSITCLKMELGEPDSSGRRRPVPVLDSEFDVEVDYILAAIGQKTVADFLDDIKAHAEKGEVKANRWGDLEADPNTLQTGIPSVFAAGDGVTGPATLIAAIAQARKASYSCDQFLRGVPVEPMKKEFFSSKDIFKPQRNTEYKGGFAEQKREEMPTLDPKDRNNFAEVELGYSSEEVAYHETQRCLECGCTALFTCDLKRYSSDYGADQKAQAGEFKEYQVDFRHPYIEFDNNKCILCSRCVRICSEVVGADALGLVNRGFNTYVAPSMGYALQDTPCESCGMCISTCPTGAITENVPFKPGPVKLSQAETICNYCSVGCTISLNHKSQFVMNVTGVAGGQVNTDGNLCRYPKFGYHYMNDKSRVTRPLMKINGRFEEVSFKKAYDEIAKHLKAVKADENVFFAGARLSNEEMYLIQKLARAGAKTNNVTSFHYLKRGGSGGYRNNAMANTPFSQIKDASKIYLIGSEINMDNAVAGFSIYNLQSRKGVPVELVTTNPDSSMAHKVNEVMVIKSIYHFIRAVNYYLVDNNFQNGLFIRDHCEGFEEYKTELLKENFVDLVQKAGASRMDDIIEFAKHYNNEPNAIIVYSEKELSSNACTALFHLSLITGKLGKTGSGLISLKEKNNSQGLLDMGICRNHGVGGVSLKVDDLRLKIMKAWKMDAFPEINPTDIYTGLEDGNLKNLFIFGEDPLGCASHKVQTAGWLSIADFVVVQDYFMTETAQHAHLVLPASFPVESGGSFTNTQKVIQGFEAQFKPAVEKTGLQQLADLLRAQGVEQSADHHEVMAEIVSLLPRGDEPVKYQFSLMGEDNPSRMYEHGCDYIVKRFDEEFENAFENVKIDLYERV
jgi:formate dehydrogenase major subunit